MRSPKNALWPTIAFWLLGTTRIGLALSPVHAEGQTFWYWVRLAAFVLILVAIADKNRRRDKVRH